MAEWPTTPLPQAVYAPEIILPVLEHRPDQGYSVRRPRYTRSFRRYRVEYKGKNATEYHRFQDFIEREVQGRAGVFSWVNPYSGQTIAGITNGTPNEVTTTYRHGLQTGHQVLIEGVTGLATANGTWTITRTSGFAFTLNGSTAGSAYISGGTAKQSFPRMMVVLGEDTLPEPSMPLGPVRNAEAVLFFSFTFEELL